MRHIYIRGILALIWLVAAIISATSKNFEMMVLYIAICGVFLYSTYAMWRKEKNKGEK